jgi:ABC-type uncharacterized transport system permease subunit
VIVVVIMVAVAATIAIGARMCIVIVACRSTAFVPGCKAVVGVCVAAIAGISVAIIHATVVARVEVVRVIPGVSITEAAVVAVSEVK